MPGHHINLNDKQESVRLRNFSEGLISCRNCLHVIFHSKNWTKFVLTLSGNSHKRVSKTDIVIRSSPSLQLSYWVFCSSAVSRNCKKSNFFLNQFWRREISGVDWNLKASYLLVTRPLILAWFSDAYLDLRPKLTAGFYQSYLAKRKKSYQIISLQV